MSSRAVLVTSVLSLIALGAVAAPQTVQQRMRRGLELSDDERFAAAFAEFEAVLRQRPGFPAADYELARICYRVGNSEAALGRLARVVENAPRWIAPRLLAAEVALQADEPATAAAHYDAALEVDPGAAELWVRYADALIAAAPLEEDRALDAYESAVAADPESETAWIALTYFLLNRRRFDGARAAVAEFLQRFPGSPYALLITGQLRRLAGDDEGTLDAVERALANLDAGAAGSTSDAAREAPRGFLVDLLELQGRALLNLNRLPEAERVARELVELDRSNLQGIYLLGTSLMRAGSIEGPDYLAAFRRRSDARAHQAAGDEHLEEGRPAAAARAFEQAAEIDGFDPVTFTGLGTARLALGDIDGAIEALDRARTLGAADLGWYRQWVLALDAAGRTDEARQVWQRVRAAGGSLGPQVWAALGPDIC